MKKTRRTYLLPEMLLKVFYSEVAGCGLDSRTPTAVSESLAGSIAVQLSLNDPEVERAGKFAANNFTASARKQLRDKVIESISNAALLDWYHSLSAAQQELILAQSEKDGCS